jgi:WD40 repeat protein
MLHALGEYPKQDLPGLVTAVPDLGRVGEVAPFLVRSRTGTQRGLLKGYRGHIRSIAFHPDGKILTSANWDGTVSLWDLATGQERMVLTDNAKLAPDRVPDRRAGDHAQ